MVHIWIKRVWKIKSYRRLTLVEVFAGYEALLNVFGELLYGSSSRVRKHNLVPVFVITAIAV